MRRSRASGGATRDREHETLGAACAHCARRGARGRARGNPVVNQDHGSPLERETLMLATVQARAALELDALSQRDAHQVVPRQARVG
jgi:hypothetical protein